MKEILSIPWGDGEDKIGLRVIEMLKQGFGPPITRRYGATKLEVDKDGNIYQLLPKEDGVHLIGRSEVK